MLYNRKVDRLLLLVVPLGLFIYASTRPHVRLRADMPPQFVDISASAGPKQRTAEETLARKYWQCVETTIQWKYTYGSPLPETPPMDFRVEKSADSGSDAAATSSRMRYWRRLQRVWVLPSSWVTSHAWSTTWLTDPIKDAFNWLNNYITNLFAKG
jgi:hypothetical protein